MTRISYAYAISADFAQRALTATHKPERKANTTSKEMAEASGQGQGK